MDKTIVIEEATLRSMAANGAFLKEFPFLAALRLPVRGDSRCGRCQTGQLRKSNQTLKAVKSAIGGLSQERGERMKAMLGASKLVVRYLDRRGKATDKTF